MAKKTIGVQQKKRTQLLKAAFDRVQKQNPAFSIRALARKMNLSAPFVSKVFSGAAELPLNRVRDFAQALKMDQVGEKALLETYVNQGALKLLVDQPKEASQGKKLELQASREIPDRHHFLLTEWYYLPILDLTLSSSYDGTEAWLANKLRLKAETLQEALILLKGNGFLVEREGRWVKSDPVFRFPVIESKETIRKFHQMMLKKAIDYMQKNTSAEDYRKRLISGFLFAGNGAQIEKAKIRMNDAMLEIVEILQTEGEGSTDQKPEQKPDKSNEDIFYFANVFFPMTEIK